MEDKKISVLFVCLGNICRSPMAEMVFIETVRQRGILDRFLIDSAGTYGGHVGDSPDKRSAATCKNHFPNLKVTHKARQLCDKDFTKFNHILCMDQMNYADIEAATPKNSTAVLRLLGSFDPNGEKIIEDPYYGGMDAFEHNFQQIQRSCNAFINFVTRST
eukprot:TRINITY_DN11230_c0_g1_i1.p1 TRINITY_DN11230_c0_g1~~TRINITY_DN11230_c0_g1_i1.p1  ORF type:complete len:161 (+),score=22.84 TRINITY_DN11230_c0_g1_i1:54-536(+)